MTAWYILLLSCNLSVGVCEWIEAVDVYGVDAAPTATYEECIDLGITVVVRDRWHGYRCEERRMER